MALKNKYSKRDEVPAELATFYVEREGAFHLDAERDGRIDEMRATSVAALKELAEFKQRFAGIDPDEVAKLTAEKARLEEERLIKGGEAEKVYASRLAAATAELEKKFAPKLSALDAATRELSEIKIDQAVVAEAMKRGLRPTALPDLLMRARSAFKLVGGVPQLFAADGVTVLMGKDGVTPKSPAEWVEALGTDAPHFFSANAGGGAAGYGPGGVGTGLGVDNPFRKDRENITRQMEIYKTDPALAARVKAAG